LKVHRYVLKSALNPIDKEKGQRLKGGKLEQVQVPLLQIRAKFNSVSKISFFLRKKCSSFFFNFPTEYRSRFLHLGKKAGFLRKDKVEILLNFSLRNPVNEVVVRMMQYLSGMKELHNRHLIRNSISFDSTSIEN
jgi:hypothetical protein